MVAGNAINEEAKIGELALALLVALIVVMAGVVTAIVFLETGRRKIPVQYAKRVIGRKVFGGQSTHIPLKINTAGVIPPIFASSLIAFPATIAGNAINEEAKIGELALALLVALIVVMAGVVTAIVFLETGRRKIPVQYAKRVIGRKVFGGQSTHIPLKINTAGVIPPIFASSLIAFPATIAGFVQVPWVQSFGAQLAPGSVLYTLVYVGLIVFFCFFYTVVILNPVDMADNLKKYGGFIPGIRPGQRTSDYIYKVLTRVTFAGSIYLAIVCVIPEIMIYKLNVPFYFGGTSLLIVIGVGLDTAQQIESHMLMRDYGGFLGRTPMPGRR